tara:strand:+ start:636 stop:788 length:153 start_codon:yes stop_codon:yes gene_type:complete
MNREEYETLRAEALHYATLDYDDAVALGNQDEANWQAHRIEEIKNDVYDG